MLFFIIVVRLFIYRMYIYFFVIIPYNSLEDNKDNLINSMYNVYYLHE